MFSVVINLYPQWICPKIDKQQESCVAIGVVFTMSVKLDQLELKHMRECDVALYLGRKEGMKEGRSVSGLTWAWPDVDLEPLGAEEMEDPSRPTERQR